MEQDQKKTPKYKRGQFNLKPPRLKVYGQPESLLDPSLYAENVKHFPQAKHQTHDMKKSP